MNSSRQGRNIGWFSICIQFPCLAVATLIFLSSSVDAAAPTLFGASVPKIAIDPGHGGADAGAQGPTGQLEKTIALEIAQRLTLKLEAHYQVILTRSDDYNMTLQERSAIANQTKADMLIGIHTGAGFLHRTNSVTVYYYRPINVITNASATIDGANRRQHWDQAQIHHRDASVSLATTVHKNLERMDGVSTCKIMSAPLTLLEGADMPAVVIEVGHITHPGTEKKLSSPQGVEMLINAIENGIKEFVASTTKKRHPAETGQH